jgi:hypothetical protein
MKLEDVTDAERVLRERVYENGKACGFLPHEIARRMGWLEDFDQQTCKPLYKKISDGTSWC